MASRTAGHDFSCYEYTMPLTSNLPTNDPASMLAPLASVTASPCTDPPSAGFTDRRASFSDAGKNERRQFASSHSELSPDARELAIAIDRYKLQNRRRYITCEEMLAVVKLLGYHRD